MNLGTRCPHVRDPRTRSLPISKPRVRIGERLRAHRQPEVAILAVGRMQGCERQSRVERGGKATMAIGGAGDSDRLSRRRQRP
jgi:hypothetical protein